MWRKLEDVLPRTPLVIGAAALGGCLAGAAGGFAAAAGPGLAGYDVVATLFICASLLGLGALIAIRRPGNAVGPVLLAGGLVLSALQLANWYAIVALIARPGTPGGLAALVATQALVPAGYVCVFALLPLVFPDGRFLSPAWRRLALAMGALAAVATVLAPLFPTIVAGTRTVANPIGVLPAAVADPLGAVLWLLFSAGVLAALASLALRYRRSDAQTRRRIRWIAAALGLTGAVVVETQLAQIAAPALALPFEATPVALATVPAAIGVAMLRDRLFDIDLVVRRSVVYGSLWLAIAAGYAALAAALGLAAGQRLPVAAAVLATIAATLAFQPARSRLERLADRVAYGRRAGAYELLRDFGAATERTLDVEEIGPRLAEAARAGLRARWARVLFRSEVLAQAGEAAGSPALSAPLVRDGQEVGRIEAGPRTEGGYGARDAEVLATLGRQAALAIHNAGLASELQQRVATVEQQARELAASRSRIVQAQEEERRRIERDLHDGVQQQLISLVAGLRLARNRVRGDADAADAALEGVQGQALQTLKDLRTLVRGIHPAVLSDGGIVRAIEAAAAQSPLDITLDVDDRVAANRYPPEVEGALYFVASEALANVMKHAGDPRACVGLQQRDGTVVLTVSDVGRGFGAEAPAGSGLRGLRDRVSALGGELDVCSEPGQGTTVTASLPVGNRD